MKNTIFKFINIFLIFSILFSILPATINAIDEQPRLGIVKTPKENGINIRSGAGVGFDKIGTGIAEDQIVTIYEEVNEVDGTKACESGTWYKIKYLQVPDGIGYACSSFIKILPVETNDEFEASLLTFPESYRPYLKTLHTIYPNAVFRAYDTDLDFNEAVRNESVEGKSLVWDDNNSREGLKLLSSFNFETYSFRNTYSGGGKNWYAANEETIAYYLDPRNFLSEKQVFMFEVLSYNSMYHNNIEGIESVLKSSFMYNTYVDGQQEKKFSDVILSSSTTYKLSPYYVVSRILQETGNTRSALVLGTYPNYPMYNGYYNFFNYGAGGDNVVENGLTYAYNQGWNSEEKAIIGGVSKLSGSYILAGQDTNYFQKWNVACKTVSYACYTHQYMQNIEATNSEAKTTYNAYKNSLGADMYNLGYVFTIPVFKNMPDVTLLPSSLSPINHLKNIIINKNLLNNFDPQTYEYNLTVPYNTTSINLEASSISEKAKITGIGNIEFNSDKQDLIINVTAQNGTDRNYTVHVTRSERQEPITLDDIINDIKGIKFNENKISGITSIDVLKERINDSNINITVKNKNGEVIKSGNLGTGYKIILEYNGESKEFEMVLYGDTNGDASITILDLLRVQKQLLKSISLTEVEYLSADVNKDGTVTILDLLLVQKHLLGSKYIEQ